MLDQTFQRSPGHLKLRGCTVFPSSAHVLPLILFYSIKNIFPSFSSLILNKAQHWLRARVMASVSGSGLGHQDKANSPPPSGSLLHPPPSPLCLPDRILTGSHGNRRGAHLRAQDLAAAAPPRPHGSTLPRGERGGRVAEETEDARQQSPPPSPLGSPAAAAESCLRVGGGRGA